MSLRFILSKALLKFWPWKEIAYLKDALSEANKQISLDADRYNRAYYSGYTNHRNVWLATANIHYDSHPFEESEKNLMIHLYNDGYSWSAAVSYLRTVRNINGFMS